MKRTAAALKFALFVIAATALVFLLIEGGARVYVYVRDSGAAPGEPSVGPVTVELQPYKEYNVLFHTPNQDLVDTRIPSRKFHITINSFGFRGREITEKKPPGVVRIMVLGDSYTFGDGVDDEDTLPWALEDMLNERDAGVRYEVINAGVMGSYIKNESELYFNYARRFDPDVLILAYCWNDISEVAYFKFYKRLEEVAGQGAGHEDGRLARVARDTKIHSIAQQKKARDMAKRENEFVANKSGALNLGMLVEKTDIAHPIEEQLIVELYSK